MHDEKPHKKKGEKKKRSFRKALYYEGRYGTVKSPVVTLLLIFLRSPLYQPRALPCTMLFNVYNRVYGYTWNVDASTRCCCCCINGKSNSGRRAFLASRLSYKPGVLSSRVTARSRTLGQREDETRNISGLLPFPLRVSPSFYVPRFFVSIIICASFVS